MRRIGSPILIFLSSRRLRAGEAGSGSLGDIGSHIIDLGRYLVGEFLEVCATLQTFVKERPREDDPTRKGCVTVADAALAIERFRNGALATLEATRFAPGRKNSLTIEINGSGGSLAFNLEEMNRLQFYDAGDPKGRRGFRDILVTESTHLTLAAGGERASHRLRTHVRAHRCRFR